VQQSAPPIGFVDTPGSAVDVAISGRYAFVADQTSVQIVDMSVPSAPALVNSLPLAASVVATSGNLLLVGGAARTLVDIGDPAPSRRHRSASGDERDRCRAGGRSCLRLQRRSIRDLRRVQSRLPVPRRSIGDGITRLEVQGE
jgi:hypothetical protein